MKRYLALTLFLLSLSLTLYSQTIAEKKKGLVRGVTDLSPQLEAELVKVNAALEERRTELNRLYDDVYKLVELNAPDESFERLLQMIQETRAEINALNESWRRVASQSSRTDLYALWHQPETTVEQLVLDYGAQDYVYVMPPEIQDMKISVNSNIPIPKAAWENMLELILAQNGIGIRQLNPYLRELYEVDEEASPVSLITNRAEDLAFLPQEKHIAFLITPDPSDVKRTLTFLQKFVNPKATKVEQIGRDILVISQVGNIKDLLKLYDFVASSRAQRQYKLVPLSKIKAQEMANVIASMFDHMAGQSTIFETETGTIAGMKDDEVVNGLKIIVLESLSQALFLVGTREEIRAAEEMIARIESKIGGGREKVVHWYRSRHSSAQDLANVLQQIYAAMIAHKIGDPGQPGVQQPGTEVDQTQNVTVNEFDRPEEPFPIFDNNYYLYDEPVISTPAIDPGREVNEKEKAPKKNPNFIVDEKTGSIVMVVEKDLLPRLLEIVAKLDVAKKMVQIDVLVLERRTRERTEYGLNLLKVGGCADNKRLTCLDWSQPASLGLGVFEFLLSRPRTDGGAPAFDLIYRFLLTQENLTVNANPSIIAINQTPAEISIRDEISIDTGVNFIATTNANTPRQSFKREQYGITIKVTPTVHLWSEDEGYDDDVDYVTLETYINFDTIVPVAGQPDRPEVLRRELENEVLIADGQTVVMGGLRRKDSRDEKQSIPFFGEIPGFGKLFSMTELDDRTTELIIFMTPKIIHDPCEDIERVKFEKLLQRPGDLPCFLCRMNESREYHRRRAFSHTVRILCGQQRDGYYPAQIGCVPASMNRIDGGYCSYGEYDGR